MRYFDKFSQADNQRVFTNLYQWFFGKLCFDNYTLDFDSTVEQRCGEQKGAAKGYNPKRPGRQSHHPLLAFVADLRMIANFWLRPGNTSASTNFLSFLEDTLEKLHGKRVGLVRMDSGFFSDHIMKTLEEKELNYIIACRFNNRIKHQLVYERKWANEACANFIIMAYNLYSLFRLVMTNNQSHPVMKSIRYSLLAIPGYIRKSKDKKVLYLARSLTTRKAFKGIWEAIDDLGFPYYA